MAWLVRVLLLQDLLQSCSRGGGYPRQWCVFIVPAGRDNNQSHGPAYGPLKKRATGAVAPKSSRACEWGGGTMGGCYTGVDAVTGGLIARRRSFERVRHLPKRLACVGRARALPARGVD